MYICSRSNPYLDHTCMVQTKSVYSYGLTIHTVYGHQWVRPNRYLDHMCIKWRRRFWRKYLIVNLNIKYYEMQGIYWGMKKTFTPLYLGTVMKVWYVLFFIIFRNCSEGVVCLVYRLYLGTVLKVWYVLFFIIFRNCPEGVVCLVYRFY